MTFLLVSLAGGLGCVLRFGLSTFLEGRNRLGLPVATLVINVVGAFLLGLLTSVATRMTGFEELKTILGVGLLGGFTTFSSASVEAAQMLLEHHPRMPSAVGTSAGGRWRTAIAKSVDLAGTMLVAGIAAGSVGLAIG